MDSLRGAVLAHWMRNTFAAGSLITAAALLGLSALLACLASAATPALSHPTSLSAMNRTAARPSFAPYKDCWKHN